MNSIGNDVVALAGINPERTRQFRFYSKILSTNEQNKYPEFQLPSLPFEHYVWLLWSVKESAYKFAKRLQPGLVFSPTKIIVDTISSSATGKYTGIVKGYGITLHFDSAITDEYIHSIVSAGTITAEQLYFKVEQITSTDYASQSAAVKEIALNGLSKLLPETELFIDKHTAGYPQLLINQQLSLLPISFSHNGSYVAYTFLFDKMLISRANSNLVVL